MWNQPYRKSDVEAGGRQLYPTMLENPQLRWSFIRKVYSIVSIQLLLTVAVASVVVTVHPIKHFFASTGAGLAVYIVLIITPLIVLFPLYYYHQRHPYNYFLLGIFTVAISFAVGLTCAFTKASLNGHFRDSQQLLSFKARIFNQIPFQNWELGAELRHLTREPVQTDCTKVVYLVRAQLDLMKSICSQIHHDTSKGIQRDYFLYFVPRRAVVCEKILEEEKVHHLLTIVQLQVLRQRATSMKQDYTEMQSTSQSVSELKDFVKKPNSLPEMTRHINLAQHLTKFTSKPSFLGRLDMEHTIVESESYDICMEYIEEMIHKQEPLLNVLRLLILFSITNSGLPKRNFDYLRRELLHSYGFEHMATLNNLEKAGLFRKQESKSNWITIKRALQLVVEDTDTANPDDISYVFSGYAPLSIRLVQHAIRSGWRPIEEILRMLPGPHSDSKRSGFASSPSYDNLLGSVHNSDKVGDGRRSVVLVVFIGGVTFAEINALRFLSSQEGMAYDLIVLTTNIVNGHTLTDTFVEKLG